MMMMLLLLLLHIPRTTMTTPGRFQRPMRWMSTRTARTTVVATISTCSSSATTTHSPLYLINAGITTAWVQCQLAVQFPMQIHSIDIFRGQTTSWSLLLLLLLLMPHTSLLLLLSKLLLTRRRGHWEGGRILQWQILHTVWLGESLFARRWPRRKSTAAQHRLRGL